MEYRNKIILTERKRQTMASAELAAKFFSDYDSILIVQNQMIKDAIIQNHFPFAANVEEFLNRIVFKNNSEYAEYLEKYDTWYLDVCTDSFTKEIINLALDKRKTLIGHYENKKEAEQLYKEYGEHRFQDEH